MKAKEAPPQIAQELGGGFAFQPNVSADPLAVANDWLPGGRYFDSSNRRRTASAASRIPSEALASVGAKLRSRRRRSATVILA